MEASITYVTDSQKRLHYNQKDLAGRGYSLVYQGTYNDRTAAIKRIQAYSVSEDIMGSEVKTMKCLEGHSNIVNFFHAERDYDFYYIAMELCAGDMSQLFLPETDEKKYRGPPLPSDIQVLMQLTEGLDYIHSMGYVHRDVKPFNVLISLPDENGNPPVMKWCDFGSAIELNSIDGTYSSRFYRGTVGWMAPEEFYKRFKDGNRRKMGRETTKGDIWSAGCLFFYYLTSGTHPFGESQEEMQYHANQNHDPVNISVLDYSIYKFKELIMKMIRHNPEERITLQEVKNLLKNEDERVKSLPGKEIRSKKDIWQLCAARTWGKDDPERFEWLICQNNTDMLNYKERTTSKTPLICLCSNTLHHDKLRKRVQQLLRLSSKSLISDVIVSANDKFDRNALHYLCQTYKRPDLIKIAEILLKNGIDASAKDIYGRNALHYLCASVPYGAEQGWKKEIVKKFIYHYSYDFTAIDNLGRHFLHFWIQHASTEKGFLEITNRLIYNKKNMEKLMGQKDSFGRNPLHYLSKYCKGTDLKTLVKSSIECCDVNDTDEDGKNALHYLCSENYNHSDLKEIIEILINGKIDVKAKGDNGRNALHDICISNYKGNDFIEIIRLLINAGIDVDEKNDFGETALEDLLWESDKTWEALNPIVHLLITSSREISQLTEAGKVAKLENCRLQIQTRNENISGCAKTLISYSRTDILGRGINNVYRGTFNEKTVAVKVIEIAKLRSIENKREEKAMKKLNHENIVKLFHVEDQDQFRCYAMEICDASMGQIFGPYKGISDEKKQALKDCFPAERRFLIQMAQGLEYIHSKKLVHRDIKPDNALLTLKGLIKWCDFGMSKIMNRLGRYSISNRKPGTDTYRATEVETITFVEKYDEDTEKLFSHLDPIRRTDKSDVFSAGCTFFYFWKRGIHPFGNGRYEIDKNIDQSNPVHLNREMNMNDNISSEDHFIYDIIGRMIAKKTEDRLSMKEVVVRLVPPRKVALACPGTNFRAGLTAKRPRQ